MFSLKAEDIYDVVSPLHWSSNLFGLTSFSIIRVGKDFEVTASFFNILCISLSTVWSLLAEITFLNSIEMFAELIDDKFSKFFEKSALYITLISLLLSIASNWWIFLLRKKFSEILRLLNEVDEELKKMGEVFNLRRHKKVVLIFVFTVEVIIGGALVTTYLIKLPGNWFFSNVLNITGTFLAIGNIFTCFHFSFWIWGLKLRIVKFNSIFEMSAPSLCIEKLASLHHKFFDISELLNHCYGVPVSLSDINLCSKIIYLVYTLQTLLMTASNFSSMIIYLFTAIKISHIEIFGSRLLCVNLITQTIIYCFMIYSIIHISHFTKHEVEFQRATRMKETSISNIFLCRL